MNEDPNLQTETDDGTQEPVAPVQPNQPVVPEVDYKEKFAQSTRENQILNARIEALEKAGKESTNDPTDSELRTAFPEWDALSDFEKGLARRTIAAERSAGRAASTTRELQEERAWNTSIEFAISSDPALSGKESSFRQFASKPQYRNVPIDVLTAAFLQRNGASAPQPQPRPTPKPGLETGNGGPRTPEKPKELSAEELQALRKTDEKAYVAYVKEHPNALDADL